jgi:hypothetical protein
MAKYLFFVEGLPDRSGKPAFVSSAKARAACSE